MRVRKLGGFDVEGGCKDGPPCPICGLRCMVVRGAAQGGGDLMAHPVVLGSWEHKWHQRVTSTIPVVLLEAPAGVAPPRVHPYLGLGAEGEV